MITVNNVQVPDEHHAQQVRLNPTYLGKGTYRWDKLADALPYCERRGHAIDVGAHVGLWTRVLAHEFGRVSAFEPVPDFVLMLCQNIEPSSNVDIYRQALGHVGGHVALELATDGRGTARIARGGDVRAPVGRLDDLDVAPPDFLKISCEGAEYPVLLGGERSIRKAKPVIVIEQKPKRMARQGQSERVGVELLKTWGATVFWEYEGDFCMGWEK